MAFVDRWSTQAGFVSSQSDTTTFENVPTLDPVCRREKRIYNVMYWPSSINDSILGERTLADSFVHPRSLKHTSFAITASLAFMLNNSICSKQILTAVLEFQAMESTDQECTNKHNRRIVIHRSFFDSTVNFYPEISPQIFVSCK